MARKYKAKICKSCDKAFVPRSGVQKICDDCRAKKAARPVRPPTATIEALQGILKEDGR